MSANKTFNSNNEINVCADCGQTDPTWASINHGVLVCDQCAIIHLSLGRFISQIKSLKCPNWKSSQLQMVCDLYRNGANSIWEHTLLDPHVLSSSSNSNVIKGFSSHSGFRKKPLPNDPLHPIKSDFIRAKYQLFAYVNKAHANKDDPESESDISEQLHSSVRTPNLKTSLRLLAAGANPNYIHSEKFNSPLHMAAKSGQMSQIELLLVYGANLALLDSRNKTAIDYAREVGHIEIVNRLIEHQFDLTDCLTRYICLGRQPNHLNGEHFLIVDIRPECLNTFDNSTNNYNEETQKSQNLFRNELHQSIQSLSHKSFQELTRDIYDEIDRREVNSFITSYYAKEKGKLPSNIQQLILPFLPVYQFFSSTRNQGRQKLALLNTKEFTLFIVDVLNEIRLRIYGYNSVSSLRIDGYTNVTKYSEDFDEDDSEPLYDSVPSEGDYDECNEVVPSIVSKEFSDGRVSSATLVTNSSASPGINQDKNYVSMSEYSVLKEQMLKSAHLMEQFFNENKEMRVEIQRLQGIVEKLVDENVQLRQLVIPPKQNSSNSLNNELKSNSVLFDSSEQFNRNSFLRGSNRVRPQSISYMNSSNNNRYSNECISMKAPSNVITHSLSHSPSKSSNSSLLNFQHQQAPQPNQVHHSLNVGSNMLGVFVNSSNSSSSSLSSQPHQNQPSIIQHPQIPYLASSSDPNPTHFSGLNSLSLLTTSTPLVKNFSLPSPLPSKEDVIKKIEFITNSIKELLSNARECKHDEFSVCSERICNYVSEMIHLFPESLGTTKIDNLLQVNQALVILQENALRLHEECNSYELNALPSIYHKPQLNSHSSNQDYRFIYNNVIDKAAEVASSVKVIVSHYNC